MKNSDKRGIPQGFQKKICGVLKQPEREYYRDRCTNLVSVPRRDFYSPVGLRTHFVDSLGYSLAFLGAQTEFLQIEGDNIVTLVRGVLNFATYAPAERHEFRVLLSEWLCNAHVSIHLVSFALWRLRRYITAMPVTILTDSVLIARIDDASSRLGSHWPIVHEALRQWMMEGEGRHWMDVLLFLYPSALDTPVRRPL